MSRFIVHDNVGLRFQDGSSNFGKNSSKFEDVEGKIKCFIISKNGQRVAWIVDGEVRVFEGPEWKKIGTLRHPKAQDICFSPLGNYLAIWDTYSQVKGAPPTLNMSIYSVTERKLLRAFSQKSQSDWKPQWTDDEAIMARMNHGEVHFYNSNDLNSTLYNKSQAKLKSYSMSPSVGRYFVTFFIAANKGSPANVQLYKYPNFKDAGQALASKSSFKVDSVETFWNPQCDSVLLITTAETDKSGASYYGDQMLFYLNSKGDSNSVTFAGKKGHIRSVAWTKTGKEFVAVYGSAPAKATIFNHKCDPVKEFGENARNLVMINPPANLVILGAMGNISSRFEVWDLEKVKQISGQEVSDITHMEWSPCGQYFLTSTCSPRLRVNNGYKVWHYSGTLVHEKLYPTGSELYRASWLTDPKLSENTFTISAKAIVGIKTQSIQASKERYIPPSQRAAMAANQGAPVDTAKKFLSQRVNPVTVETSTVEGDKAKKKKEFARLKKIELKKKKEESKGMDKDWREERPEVVIPVATKSAKKKKKNLIKENGDAEEIQSQENATAEVGDVTNESPEVTAKSGKKKNKKNLAKENVDSEQKIDPANGPPKSGKKKNKKNNPVTENGDAVEIQTSSSGQKNDQAEGSDDVDSGPPKFAAKKIKKKLESIKKIKEDVAAGKQVDPERLNKLATEQELINELKRLTVKT